MVDIVDKATRSRMMSGIRSSNTKPEIMVRKSLHSLGLRFARSSKGLIGRPDLVLPKWRVVIFVHGCFWHRHGCELFKLPGSNPRFWSEKLGLNAARDERTCATLVQAGWRVATVWECATRGRKHDLFFSSSMSQLATWIRSETGSSAFNIARVV